MKGKGYVLDDLLWTLETPDLLRKCISDILAELNLPPSGISAYEDDVPLPAGVSLDNKSSKLPKRPEETPPEVVVLLYYSAQIQLRKILNRAHTVLYGRSRLRLSTSQEILLEKAIHTC